MNSPSKQFKNPPVLREYWKIHKSQQRSKAKTEAIRIDGFSAYWSMCLMIVLGSFFALTAIIFLGKTWQENKAKRSTSL